MNSANRLIGVIFSIMGGITISWIIIPGIPVINTPRINGKKGGLKANIGPMASRASPYINLPIIIAEIKDKYIFFLFLEYRYPATKANAANSNAINTVIGGEKGGILVSRVLNSGVINPITTPKKGPKIKAVKKTGICIGEIRLPSVMLPTKFTILGRSIPSAKSMLAQTNFRIL